MESTLIYVAVDGRNVDIWCPVRAVREHNNCYRITEANDDPEHWYQQFDLGDIVMCKNHTFAEGEFGLIAYERCNHI